MTAERLYKVVELHEDGPEEVEFTEPHLDEPRPEPEGWAAHCQEIWGEHREFWMPSTRRIYRSRSAAVERAALINRWGGNAVVLECTPEWRDTEVVKRQRKIDAQFAKVNAAERALAGQRSKLALLLDGADR